MEELKSDIIYFSNRHTVILRTGYTYAEHTFIRIMNITRNTCIGLKIDQTLVAALLQHHTILAIKIESVRLCSSFIMAFSFNSFCIYCYKCII